MDQLAWMFGHGAPSVLDCFEVRKHLQADLVEHWLTVSDDRGDPLRVVKRALQPMRMRFVVEHALALLVPLAPKPDASRSCRKRYRRVPPQPLCVATQ